MNGKTVKMDYARFRTERELVKAVFRNVAGLKTYPSVSRLAQQNIEPDIDILNISYQNKIEGFVRSITPLILKGVFYWMAFAKPLRVPSRPSLPTA